METVESMRTKINRQSLRRIKVKIKKDLEQVSEFFKAQTARIHNEGNRKAAIFTFGEDGSLVETVTQLNGRLLHEASAPSKSFAMYSLNNPVKVNRRKGSKPISTLNGSQHPRKNTTSGNT